jgi:phage tail sheath protein FI
MNLVGIDGVFRTGMYALRNQSCGIALLADCDDSTTWSTQASFGLGEGIYMILAGPAGDTIANAVSTLTQAGVDSYAAKLMFGDWLWWSDQTNQTIRLVSPQGFVAGRLANLSPEQSSLNKPIYGIIASQKTGSPNSGQATTYSDAELGTLFEAGLDVICTPQPGGAFWGVRAGHNTSSNSAVCGDNYTRLTNYIAESLAAGMGQYVGQVINNDLFQNIRATLTSFLNNMLSQGMLGTASGAMPFSVICDASNNPASRTGLGYVQADVQVQYQAINERFIVNVEGGQTVQISKQTLPQGQVS